MTQFIDHAKGSYGSIEEHLEILLEDFIGANQDRRKAQEDLEAFSDKYMGHADNTDEISVAQIVQQIEESSIMALDLERMQAEAEQRTKVLEQWERLSFDIQADKGDLAKKI